MKEIQQPLTRSFEWWRDCNETDPKTMLTQVIQQPLKNPSGKCNLLDIGWTNEPAAGEDYPLKPMHLLNEPCIELPYPPVGQKWEYRGRGWTGEGTLLVCGGNAYNVEHLRFASGEPTLHYWEAVDVVPQKEFKSDCFCSPDSFHMALEKVARQHPSVFNVFELTPEQESEIVKEQDKRLKDEYDCEPQYRMLEEGEIIRDGDEYFYHGKGMWEGTAGYHGHGRKYSKAFWGSDVRRPLPQLTDSQKLTLAIEALEKARGWTVADEVLKQIL